MTATGRPPFRADHIGSLLRPAALRQAFRRHAAGEIGEEDYARVQDQCIRDVVRMQEEIGLEVVTDGEFRRASYWNRFATRVEGLALRPAGIRFRDESGHETEFEAPYAAGKVRRRQPLAVDEFSFLRGVTKVTPKITLPAPSTMHFYGSRDYAAPARLLGYRGVLCRPRPHLCQEIAELAKAGCTYVQLDEVAVALLGDPAIRANVERVGGDPDRLVDLYIEAINQAVGGTPARRGHRRPRLPRQLQGSLSRRRRLRLDRRAVFQPHRRGRLSARIRHAARRRLCAAAACAEGQGGRARPRQQQDAGAGKQRRRSSAAPKRPSRFIDLDRLALSPQCGFASSVAGNPLTEADERAKLRLVVETARAIWG